MKFYTRGNAFIFDKPDSFPAICLRTDNWNDFGYRTLFYLDYYDEDENITELGAVNILKLGEDTTILPPEFERLNDKFCSVGQRRYYKGLKEISPKTFTEVLISLRDCLVDDDIAHRFQNEDGFKKSLNRDNAFVAVKKWFSNFINNITDDPQEFRFKFFTCVGKNNTGSMTAEFDFAKITDENNRSIDEIPNRVNLIVGKNGCGKTTCLAKIANYFAKIDGSDKQRIDGLEMQFSNIIVISYSMFDSFTKPFQLNLTNNSSIHAKTEDIKRKVNNYIYCGLIGVDGTMSFDEMKGNFLRAHKLIVKRGREEFWITQVEILLQESSYYSPIYPESLNLSKYEELGLSSGQYFLYSIISELIANIEENSLIIIDEPEIHLHPNAISNLLKVIYAILEEYNSYAIMATHSPIILQEVPSRFIVNMIRDDSNSFTIKLPLETFGNELSTIVDKVFDVIIKHSTYKSVFEALTQNVYSLDSKKTDYDIINSYFNDKLSFNSRVFIQSLLEKKKRK